MSDHPPAGTAPGGNPKPPPPKQEKKPWPLTWVAIAILLYILLQTAWIAYGN